MSKTEEHFQSKAEEYAAEFWQHECKGVYQTRHDYLAGCEHGYQYAVDKACEWLREHLGVPSGMPQAKSYNDAINELTTEFCKGMEE